MEKKKISTATSVAGVKFDSCVCNASGVKCTTLEELREIGRSDSCAIVMKSTKVEEEKGNPEPRWHHLGENGMVQAMGLPGLGHKKYIEFSYKLKKYEKPIIASVVSTASGKEMIDEYVKLVTAFHLSSVDLIEVSIGCPSDPKKSQIGYDFKQTETLLRAIQNLGHKPVGLKLPPYFDPHHWDIMAELMLRYNISFGSFINSLGNVLVIDPWKRSTVTKPKKGYAGLCGDGLEYIANANINAFYERGEGKYSIFGVGAVKDGVSGFCRILAGADALQVGTAFEMGNHRIFSKIDGGVAEMLRYHGFKSVQEAKGQLLHI